MNCRRSEELWTDHLEGTLPAPLENALREHLASCEACSELFPVFEEVVFGLHALEAPTVPETVLEHVLDRTRVPLKVQSERLRPAPSPDWTRALGWVAASVVLSLALLGRPPELLSRWSTKVSRSAHQAYSFGLRTYHQTGRFIEDLNVLRMTVGVAFEDRIDELNEKLRDLERASRKQEDDEDPSSSNRGKSDETSPSANQNALLPRHHHFETRSFL